MSPAVVIIADCLPGFHHPAGRLDLCVANVVASVPTLTTFGMVILAGLIAIVAFVVFGRRK